MTERVMAVGAHPDDVELGCGATLAKHVAQGDVVAVVVLADGVSSRGTSNLAQAIQERHGACRRACKIIGTEDVFLHQFADNQMDKATLLQVTQQIETHIARFRPTVVYTHWSGDLNIDHQIVSRATMTACRPLPGSAVKRVMMFEVPSSTEWGLAAFEPTWFERVETTLQAKLDALACYTSEMREWPHPRSEDNVRMRARVRGAAVGVTAAEAFVVARNVA